jgi:hypothetical protein
MSVRIRGKTPYLWGPRSTSYKPEWQRRQTSGPTSLSRVSSSPYKGSNPGNGIDRLKVISLNADPLCESLLHGWFLHEYGTVPDTLCRSFKEALRHDSAVSLAFAPPQPQLPPRLDQLLNCHWSGQSVALHFAFLVSLPIDVLHTRRMRFLSDEIWY